EAPDQVRPCDPALRGEGRAAQSGAGPGRVSGQAVTLPIVQAIASIRRRQDAPPYAGPRHCPAAHMKPGRKRDSDGKARRTPISSSSTSMKGATPRKHSDIFTLVMLEARKTFIPKGGVTNPISAVLVMMMPNHTPSNPSSLMIG